MLQTREIFILFMCWFVFFLHLLSVLIFRLCSKGKPIPIDSRWKVYIFICCTWVVSDFLIALLLEEVFFKEYFIKYNLKYPMSFPGPLTIYIHYVILTYRKKTTMDALYDSFSKKFGMRNIKKLTKQVVRHCSNEGLWDIPISNEKIALILANFLGFASVREMFNYYADLKQVKTADISLLYDRYKEVQDKKRQKPAPTPASDSVKSANNVMAEAKAQTPSKSLKPAIDNYDVFAGKFGMNFGELLKSTVYPVDEARYNVILSLSNLDEQALSFANFFGFRTVSNMLTYFKQTGNYDIKVFFERYNQLQQKRNAKNVITKQQPTPRNEAGMDTPTVAKSDEPAFHMVTEDNFAHKFGCANFSELVFDALYDNHRKRYDFIISLPYSERPKSFANILGFDTVKDMQLYFANSRSIDDMRNRLA